MNGRIKTAIFLIFFILIAVFVVPGIIHADNPATPIIIKVISNYTEPLEIVGLTPADTEVLVYIDGNFVGLADIMSQDTETDNFVFTYPSVLTSGDHDITAVARDHNTLQISAPTGPRPFTVPALPAPTLIAPNEHTITGKVKPMITGLSVSDTLVRIWIDGVYNGKTEFIQDKSGTANFAYLPFLNLAVGEHTITAMAEDRFGHQSGDSNALTFRIEAPMPAPTIYQPVVNAKTSPDRPFITGVAKNDSLVRVYIDHVLYGQFSVDNSQSGTANFAYQPYVALTGGAHYTYTEAVDSRGKVSSWSNIVYFSVQKPTISPEAAAANNNAPGNINSSEKPPSPESMQPVNQGETASETQENVEVKGVESMPSEIENLLNNQATQTEAASGLVDETQNNQGGLRLNLIIFILFLLAVIAWIFWVNRELIKERRAMTETDSGIKKPVTKKTSNKKTES